MMATVGYYLGFVLHLPQAHYPLFLASVTLSVLVVFLWQFVIIPYDPTSALQRSLLSFHYNVALTVAAIRQELASAQGKTRNTKKRQHQLKRVHLNRRIIEGISLALVSSTSWSQTRLNRLQVEMLKTEQELDLLSEAATLLLSQLDALPEDVLPVLLERLEALEAELWEMAPSKNQVWVPEAGERLQAQVVSSLVGQAPGEWVYALRRIGNTAHQLSRSVAMIHTIQGAWTEYTNHEIPAQSHATLQAKPIASSGTKPGHVLHPTTILGIQAVLAAGLAMLVADLLQRDKPNLVYWTAFVVIAGSTGESLRRMIMRVCGAIAGTVIGLLLAIMLPDTLWLVISLVMLCLFMAIYMTTISYIWMAFWLNIAMLLVITIIGDPVRDVLALRSINTLLGATIAAVVVIFVLPIHAQDRFVAALSEFLTRVDHYIEVYIATLMSTPVTSNLRDEEVKRDASYQKLEHNLPNVMYEYNPLSRVQNHLASQATVLATLQSYLNNLESNVGKESGILAGVKDVELIAEMQSHIHETIGVLKGFLANGQGQVTPSLADMSQRAEQEVFTAEAGTGEAVRNRTLYHLTRLHNIMLQIASGLGVPIT